MNNIWKERQLAEKEYRELCDKYKLVFCNPIGVEVFLDITEILCQFSSTIDETSAEEVALKNLAAVMRSRIGLADMDVIRLHILGITKQDTPGQ